MLKWRRAKSNTACRVCSAKSQRRAEATPFRRRESSSSPTRPISARQQDVIAEIGLLLLGMTTEPARLRRKSSVDMLRGPNRRSK